MASSAPRKKPQPKSDPKPKQRRKPPSNPKPARKPASPTGAKRKPAPRPRSKPIEKEPEQKLGDTPVTPWEMPTPEEKEKAKPVKRALEKAVAEVKTQKKADEVVKNLEEAAAGKTVEEVRKTKTPRKTEAAAKKIEQTADQTPKPKKTEKVLEATGRELTTEDKRKQEVVSEAVQEVLNPEQQGGQSSAQNEQQREYLRKAVLKRQKPWDALDASLFLKINHLPHTRLLNALFYSLTFIYTGGTAWFALMGLRGLRNRNDRVPLLREAALPLLAAGLVVEHPIKKYFKRRRPFISIIQAIVIGKKPGTWSFPSGHSATAFGGAWLLNARYPRGWKLRYLLAASVAFSRIYLGDHYPGDVISGSLLGMVFAMAFRKVFRGRKG